MMKKFPLLKQFLLGLLVILLGWGLDHWSVASLEAQTPAPKLTLQQAGLTLEPMGNGVYGLVSSFDFPPPSPNTAICNGAIVIGSDGVLVVDPFQSPALAELMIDTVKTLTDKPIKYAVNTHFHQDHTGGNLTFVQRGIPVIGRGLVRELMLTQNKANDPNLTLPTVVVNSDTEIWLGDRAVKLQRVEGHTLGSDLVVYVPDAKVLIAGDLLFNQTVPFIGSGNVREWQGSLYRLIATYGDAKVLPGHGAIADVKALQAQQQYFTDLVKLAQSWKAQGLTKEQAIAQSAKLPEAYKGYKFQPLYASKDTGLANNLEVIYDQVSESNAIPLVP
ncbi:MAG: MBL fold metallo-hydrolase [Pseudanabaenaceae cyanobacterium bins.68]|nr:MBL fold metallo-hydrolase [Pseudanabaenaceae cyanobacterium bins.68]